MPARETKLNVYIATPLEREHVERIRAVDPERLDVSYEPELLPPVRYVADHDGQEGFAITDEQEERLESHLERANILWDFPPARPDGTERIGWAKNLKWIQTTSSGVGRTVERLGLHETDVLITTARGLHAGPLAEFVFLSLLAHVRRLRHLQSEQRAHHWERFCGDELEGKTLAIIGVGGVGRRVAAVGHAFGMRVVGLARAESSKTAESLGIDELFRPDGLHDMLAEADALVLAVPHTVDTARLIDAHAFAALKPGAVIVNIARGSVVDEAALVEALRSDRVAFAGLDVFAVEPLPADSPLWDMPNVLISPHSSSTAMSENRKITDVFCHNLRCFLDGRSEDLKNVFDKSKLY